MEQEQVLLSVRNLEKSFPVRSHLSKKLLGQVRAVAGVSFDLRRGEVLGLVGESGCGKSTTGYTILRLEEPTGGEIWFDGTNIATLDKRQMKACRRDMQMIFQDSHSSLNPRMSVREIIEEPLVIHRVDRADRSRRVDELLKLVGLTQEQAGRFPHEFSGGQRQRVGIARALALNPKLIIADEPVSALDVSIQAQIINLLSSLRRELGLSYLFITHDLSVARHISDRVAVMYLGEIIEMGEKHSLYANPLHPYTQLLLGAVPVPDPERQRQRSRAADDLPSPLDLPGGCHYHTRCPHAVARCKEQAPPITLCQPGHQVSCWLYGQEGAVQ